LRPGHFSFLCLPRLFGAGRFLLITPHPFALFFTQQIFSGLRIRPFSFLSLRRFFQAVRSFRGLSSLFSLRHSKSFFRFFSFFFHTRFTLPPLFSVIRAGPDHVTCFFHKFVLRSCPPEVGFLPIPFLTFSPRDPSPR